MCKKLTDINEINELIEFYFKLVPINRLIKNLSKSDCITFSTSETVALFLSGYFDEDEKEYFGEDSVEFCRFEPTFEEDVCTVISYEKFYELLEKYLFKYIQEHPEFREESDMYMKSIKERLRI